MISSSWFYSTHPWATQACARWQRVWSWDGCGFCPPTCHRLLRWTSFHPPGYSCCCHLYWRPSQTTVQWNQINQITVLKAFTNNCTTKSNQSEKALTNNYTTKSNQSENVLTNNCTTKSNQSDYSTEGPHKQLYNKIKTKSDYSTTWLKINQK